MEKRFPLKRTALYMRLSHDDEKAGESTSIENQRVMLQKYVAENGGTIAAEYIDDGWSGTDFGRPAVKQLLEDAKNGKIDTILVKDLSRFGRNYIQVGQYVDYIFPAYGIRFIALSDNVDTADRSSAGMDMMPIMNVFNEWHAANTSKKIRAVLEANWRAGRYTNWAYPYGYKAGDDEYRTAIVDEEAAKVVRRIYETRLQGNSARAIARALTDDGIPNPAAYYTRLDGKKSNRRCSPRWSAKTVTAILRDPTYIGRVTQHKTARFSYKNHTVTNVPEEERIVKENAHEPIVPRSLWEKVQAIGRSVSRGRTDGTGKVHPLSGLLVCADCGKKLKYKAGKSGAGGVFLCRTYADLGKKYCTAHSVSEKQIEDVLLQDIRSMLGEIKIDEGKAKAYYLRERAKRGAQSRASDEKRIQTLQKRLAEADKLLQSAFEEKVLGKLPERACVTLCEKYQAEKNETEKEIAAIAKRLADEKTDADGAAEYAARLQRCAACEELTREMCLQLIAFVAVGEKNADGGARQIDVYYNFSDECCNGSRSE